MPICLITPGAEMCGDARHARHDISAPDDLADALGALDAVLEGEDRRALGGKAGQALGGALRIAQLDRENDGVGGGNFARIRDDLDRFRCSGADLAVEPSPFLRMASRCEPRATNVTSLSAAARRAPK